MLIAKGVSKVFGPQQVLRDVSCEIPAGSLYALIGGNGAGKSTFLKILSGVLRPSAGAVSAGKAGQQQIDSVRSAMRCGVRAAHQEGSLIPAWSVKEHFARASKSASPPWLELVPEVSGDAKIETLRPHEKQLLEMARALSFKPAVLLADEPGAALSRVEKDRVYKAIQVAVNNGCATLVATHDLEFALAQCQQVIVLNKGQVTLSKAAKDCTLDSLLGAMGAEYQHAVGLVEAGQNRVAGEAFSIRTQTETILDIRPGEIVGVAGVSMAKEILRVACGLSSAFEAWAFLDRRQLTRSPAALFAQGILYVSRERSTEWSFNGQTVEFNLVGAILPRLARRGILPASTTERSARALQATFEVQAASLTMDFESLSGGNRQKAVLARAAAAAPHFLLLDEPFSGVDRPTRLKIFKVLRTLAQAGTGVVIYSQEVADLLNATDRIVLLKDDQSVSEFLSDKTEIGQLETSILLSSHQQ